MFFRRKDKKSRDIPISFSLHITCITMILSDLPYARSLGRLLISVPAIICGCSGETQDASLLTNRYSVKTHHAVKGSPLDIFAFEDDRFRRLDSYQRIDDFHGTDVSVASTGGEKIFFICADGQRNRYEWSDIASYHSLKDIYCDLENETHERRAMTGECMSSAGDTDVSAELKPLSCEVVLDAICCDFSGTPYAGAVIRNVKAYLTNVNASCPLLSSGESGPARIINAGMLVTSDVGRFRDQSIIVQEIVPELGKSTVFPHLEFLCYPNSPAEESPGCPFTRLVIEGVIGSDTYYWPVTVNDGKGLERGCRYVYDIFIRRKGVTDPDLPIVPTFIDIDMKRKPWEEKEEYTVGF